MELREGPDGETYAVEDRDNHMSGRDDERLGVGGFIAVMLLIAFGITILLLVWAASADASVVRCPSEDSCVADYHNGAWHVTEVTP